jgi:hypothetical protein
MWCVIGPGGIVARVGSRGVAGWIRDRLIVGTGQRHVVQPAALPRWEDLVSEPDNIDPLADDRPNIDPFADDIDAHETLDALNRN